MWLRAAIVNALLAGLMTMSHSAVEQGTNGAVLRQAAQIALMHAMGTIACATFMKMGASSAARVPSFFVLGSILYSVPIYISWPQGDIRDIVRIVGVIVLALGWISLLMSASEVDRDEAHDEANQTTSPYTDCRPTVHKGAMR